jgi:TonB family protein
MSQADSPHWTTSVFFVARIAVFDLLLIAVTHSFQVGAQEPSPVPSTNIVTSSRDNPPSSVPGSNIAPLEKVGGPVLPPRLLKAKEPEFSPQARAGRFSGVVLVDLIVDRNGAPQDVHVIHGVGMGLDENAVEAVKNYVFAPATLDGKAVPVEMHVEVNFQVFSKNPLVKKLSRDQMSQEAIDRNASGSVLLILTVDEQGHPKNIHVAQGFGMGMDEKAIEVMKEETFKPLKKDGKPVAQSILVEVKFHP